MSASSHAAWRSLRFDSFLLLSSTRVYARAHTTHEDAALPTVPADPSDLYNLTKLAGEALCLADPRATTRVVRLSNVYGIGMPAETFLGQVLREGRATGGVTFRQGPRIRQGLCQPRARWCGCCRRSPRRGRQRIYNVAAGSNTSHAAIAVLPARHRRLAHRFRARRADGAASADRHRAARCRIRPNRQQSASPTCRPCWPLAQEHQCSPSTKRMAA